MIIRRSISSRSCYLCQRIFFRQIEGWDPSGSEDIKKVQTIDASESGSLSEREAFLTQIMDRRHQTHLVRKLRGLLAQGKQEVVRYVKRGGRKRVKKRSRGAAYRALKIPSPLVGEG
jgi:hypothetical protein